MTEFTEWLNLQIQAGEYLKLVDTLPEDTLRAFTKEMLRQLLAICKSHVSPPEVQ
jgi:hypothetical protein